MRPSLKSSIAACVLCCILCQVIYSGRNERIHRESVARLLRQLCSETHVAPVLDQALPSRSTSSDGVAPTSHPFSRVRLGFFSSHFNPAHSVNRVAQGVIDGLDRALFEVFIFFTEPSLRHASKYHAEHKIPLYMTHELPVFAARRTILQQHLDILVFLDIGMDTATTEIGAGSVSLCFFVLTFVINMNFS